MEFGGKDAGGGNSSLSSTEDQDRVHGDYHTGSASRSIPYYECAFCKRGFNNAQALGGHMNIHRKDKSIKVKPKSPKSKPNFPPHNIPTPTTYSRSNLYSSQMWHHSPASPSLDAFSPNPNSGLLGFLGGKPDCFDLSLQIGTSTRYGDRDEEAEDGGESGVVDLELRLGRPPPR